MFVICTLTILSYILCVLLVEGMSIVMNVMLSLMSVMSPSPNLSNLLVCTLVKLSTLGILHNSVYVDMKYNEIALTFTAGSDCVCGMCSNVVVLVLSVMLSRCPM